MKNLKKLPKTESVSAKALRETHMTTPNSVKHNLELAVDIQYACQSIDLPTDADIYLWVKHVLDTTGKKGQTGLLRKAELTIRMVEPVESQTLNRNYRGKDKPTNVLSFQSDIPPDIPIPLLGDLIICSNVVKQEALDQNKHLQAHWAHMIMHGCLHLLNFDHINDDEAKEMEALEIRLLNAIGFGNPYLDQT